MNDPTGDTEAGLETLLERLGYRRPSWQRDALCREHPEINFHPRRGQSVDSALQVCGRCLVIFECRAWAMADPTLAHGVLGGMTANARISARRSRRQATP